MPRSCFLQAGLTAIAALSLLSARPAHAQISLNIQPFQVPGTNPGVGSIAGAVSQNGTIWATSEDSGVVAHGAILGANGSYTDVTHPGLIGTNSQGLNFLPGTVSYGGINNAGYATGQFFNFDTQGNGLTTNFIYHNGAFISPMVAGSASTVYSDVSESGLVAAVYQNADGLSHGAIYNLANGTFSLLPDIAGYKDNPVETILPDGTLIRNVGNGVYDPNTGDEYDRASLTLNNVTTFYDAPGALDTRLDQVTSTGLYVGNYLDTNDNRHGFVYDTLDGQFFTVDGAPDAVYTTLRLGNNDTQFAGFYIDANGGYHSLLVTVTPEPGSVALLVGLGVTGAGFLRRRTRKSRA